MSLHQTRKIKANYRSVTGYVSYMGEPIAYESSLERDFLIYHTFRHDVLDITPQPISIPFKKNSKTYSYTPDYFVQFDSGSGSRSLMVEVKYREDWLKNWRDWSDKWKAAIRYCNEREFKFAIYDETRIRHTALDNVNFLKSYKNLSVHKNEVQAILEQIDLRGHTTVEVILELFYKKYLYRAQGQRILWHLMSLNLIGFDIWDDLKSEKLSIWSVA